MDGENNRADSPIGVLLGAELTDEQKEYHQKAKDAGWTEKTAYDYAAAERDSRDDAEWFGAAKTYQVEWQDDFGEVGPAIPELEAILFHDEHQQRKGEHIKALEFEVNIEGPKKDRVAKVSTLAKHVSTT